MNATDDNHEHIPASADCVLEVVTAALRAECIADAKVEPIDGHPYLVSIDGKAYAVDLSTLTELQKSAQGHAALVARHRSIAMVNAPEPCPVCAVALGGVCMRCRGAHVNPWIAPPIDPKTAEPGDPRVEPRPFKVGDRVRLLAWEGEVNGLHYFEAMHRLLGETRTILSLTPKGNAVVGNWGWPTSALELVEAAP